MPPITNIPRSIKAGSPAMLWGVGNSGSYFQFAQSDKNMIDFRIQAMATSGDTRLAYLRLKISGAGSGEAVRAVAETAVTNAATGGTVNGIHASLAMLASSSISGQGFGARITFEAADDTRTLNPYCAPLLVESYIGTGNTVPAAMAHIRVTDTGAVAIKKLFRLPTVASAGLLAAHITQVMSHSIRCVDDAGTVFYIMCTNDATNRTGGA